MIRISTHGGKLGKPHYHVFLQFTGATDFSVVAKAFGVADNYVQHIKAKEEGGKPSYKKAIPYLIHKNAPEKYQYDPEAVQANFNYIQEINSLEKKMTTEARLTEIREGIDSGVIRRFNLFEYINSKEYDIYKKHIENYFKFREMQKESEHKSKQCIFIYGESGCGKTYFAKEFTKSKGLSFYVSSSSNDPLDGYKGQDVLILDDLRGSAFSFSDLLKLLDNNTDTLAKSRYYNKLLECKYIIITSIHPLEDFYTNLFEHESEPITQLRRRCPVYVKMNRHKIYIYKYDDNTKNHVYCSGTLNRCPYLTDNQINQAAVNTLIDEFTGMNVILPEPYELWAMRTGKCL